MILVSFHTQVSIIRPRCFNGYKLKTVLKPREAAEQIKTLGKTPPDLIAGEHRGGFFSSFFHAMSKQFINSMNAGVRRHMKYYMPLIKHGHRDRITHDAC